jgi:putative aldouronate transport system permease protein
MAAVALFYGLGNWNSYMDGLLYTNSSKLQLMQMYLRIVLTQTSSVNNIMGSQVSQTTEYISQSSTSMAIVTITVVPILIVYPWLSKYYVTGLSNGAVKG